jgi:hypothetical protein
MTNCGLGLMYIAVVLDRSPRLQLVVTATLLRRTRLIYYMPSTEIYE